MRELVPFVLMAEMALGAPVAAQDASAQPSYLAWNAAEAERIGRSMRVNGRVGGAFDLRVVHTEHSFNYKLRATWLTKDVIQATARLLQISERLTDSQTEELVREATAAGDVVMMVEVDPREGSGVIPNDWSAFLGPVGNDRDVVRGTNTPELEKVRATQDGERRSTLSTRRRPGHDDASHFQQRRACLLPGPGALTYELTGGPTPHAPDGARRCERRRG